MRYAAKAAAQPTFMPALIEPAVVPIATARPATQKRRRARRAPATGTAVELDFDGVAVKIAQGADAKVITAVTDALKTAR